jgi:hypothetical protein
MGIKNDDRALFLMDGNKIVINPKALFIPELSDLYKRDTSAGKKKALKEFAYIYFMSDYQAEYNSYGLAKDKQVAIDIIQNRNYKPDPMVKKAIEKYNKLQTTRSMHYLTSIRNRVDKIIAFLDKAEIENKGIDEKYKNPFITIDKVSKVLNEMESVIEKLEKWEKKVFEEEDDMKIRGGGLLNAFENPDDALWMKK